MSVQRTSGWSYQAATVIMENIWLKGGSSWIGEARPACKRGSAVSSLSSNLPICKPAGDHPYYLRRAKIHSHDGRVFDRVFRKGAMGADHIGSGVPRIRSRCVTAGSIVISRTQIPRDGWAKAAATLAAGAEEGLLDAPTL